MRVFFTEYGKNKNKDQLWPMSEDMVVIEIEGLELGILDSGQQTPVLDTQVLAGNQ